MLIWYTGHGGTGTGNWVLKDGHLKFEDIYNLYVKYFKGRCLYIVTDCCYSGAWVVECARLLDRDGIKCDHAAELQKVFIKVFAACLPNEPANDMMYSKYKGVKLNPRRGPVKAISFAEHRKLRYKNLTQTTLGVDFTKSDMCVRKAGRCIPYHTWSMHVQALLKQHRSKNYLK